MIAPGSEVGRKPVGTGPFQFVEYVPGQRLVVERYDGYWGEKAGLDSITFRFIPDGITRWLALKSGEVDLVYDLPRELLGEAQRSAGIKAGFEPGVTPAGSSEIMFLNHAGPAPFTVLEDRTVRRALAHTIDRKSIVDQIWADAAEVNNTVTPPRFLASTPP